MSIKKKIMKINEDGRKIFLKKNMKNDGTKQKWLTDK